MSLCSDAEPNELSRLKSSHFRTLLESNPRTDDSSPRTNRNGFRFCLCLRSPECRLSYRALAPEPGLQPSRWDPGFRRHCLAPPENLLENSARLTAQPAEPNNCPG